MKLKKNRYRERYPEQKNHTVKKTSSGGSTRGLLRAPVAVAMAGTRKNKTSEKLNKKHGNRNLLRVVVETATARSR